MWLARQAWAFSGPEEKPADTSSRQNVSICRGDEFYVGWWLPFFTRLSRLMTTLPLGLEEENFSFLSGTLPLVPAGAPLGQSESCPYPCELIDCPDAYEDIVIVEQYERVCCDAPGEDNDCYATFTKRKHVCEQRTKKCCTYGPDCTERSPVECTEWTITEWDCTLCCSTHPSCRDYPPGYCTCPGRCKTYLYVQGDTVELIEGACVVDVLCGE
ncbi:MAG: hypothetical protein V2G52_06380 [bacterium JZ-2024 1]